MLFLQSIIVFVVGSFFGSFAYLLYDRLGKDYSWKTIRSIISGRSKCDFTHIHLSRKELIPIRSYLSQGGKSLHSKEKLSFRYLLSEILVGLIFIITFWRGLDLLLPRYETLFRCITNTFLFGLLFFDIEKLQLHLPLWLITTLRVLIRQFSGIVGGYSIAFFGSIILVAIFAGLYYGSIHYMKIKYGKSQSGIGEGDIYMAFLLGAISPFVFNYQGIYPSLFNSINLLIYFIIISCFLGIAMAFLMKYYGSAGFFKGLESKQIPFIPAMILAYYVLLFGAINFF